MDKKPFDHIENKIKEAADNSSQYPFEEQAWNKMETLLNKGKKRRVFAWWWLSIPALIIFGAGMYWLGDHANETTVIIEKPATVVQTNNNDIKKNAQTVTDSLSTKEISDQTQYDDSLYKASLNNRTNNLVTILATKRNARVNTKTRMVSKIKASSVSSDDIAETDQPVRIKDDLSSDKKINDINVSNDSVNKTLIVAKENKKTIIKKDTTLVVTKANDIKQRTATPHGFYLLASGGADAADVNFLSFDNSTITPRLGVGIGYQLSNKFSVQTGFYEGRKKYIAGAGDYKAKSGSYLSTVDITKVDANCLVYDIPVTIRYDVIQHPGITWYATAGLSSFIMKNEAYNFSYMDNNVPGNESKTYTGNQSLFSIFDLSIGLERKLNNKFSLLAEPFISIPLSGVGDGSVKLYSTSLLFSIKYKL
jgi:outer membrane protein with beta-barrel domain